MAAHMLDHFVFTARRLSERTKSIVFGLVVFAIVTNFWWFRGVAWGINGPINDHWGLEWRKVGYEHYFCFRVGLMIFSRGIFMIEISHHPLGIARKTTSKHEKKLFYLASWTVACSCLLSRYS